MSGLEAIAAEARQSLGGNGAGEGEPRAGEFIPAGDAEKVKTDEEKKADEAQEWAGLPFFIGMLLCKPMPELREVYTEAACLEWGEKMVPVARKYNWSLAWLKAESALFVSSWALVAPSLDALKRRRAANDKQPTNDKPSEPEPGAQAQEKTHPDGSPAG